LTNYAHDSIVRVAFEFMADIVITTVAKVSEYIIGPVIREGKYFLCVGKIIRDIENERNELIFKRDNLLDRVEQAKQRTEIIEKPVEKWLHDVQSLLEEVEELEQRMRANTSCFRGELPAWRRYRIRRKMVKKVEALGKLRCKSDIQPFSHYAPLPGIQYQSSENFTYFQSTKAAYNQLLELLNDDCIYMIGVYGMGGCGKTTLVTEVGKKAQESNMFDKVISITVSQTQNIRDIQGKMADMLNLKLKEESEEGRAQRLWLSLKENKRVLVIVDDLWKEFNLMNIGIHIDNVNKGAWKILVTTRNQQVCTSMDCQTNIHLELLSKDESWTLFQKHAKITDKFSKSMDGVPRELCDKCKGLPLAIVTMASCLKGKHKSEWDVALHKMMNSSAFDDHDEGVRNALSCLELSYKYLQNKEAELLFLLCSMFPEDCNISIDDLILYAIGLGVGGRSPLKLSRSLVQVGINKLLESCLLMPAKDMQCVKMHDLVREVAIWIAKRSGNRKILLNVDKPLNTLAGDDSMQNYFAVSSWWHNENPIIGPLQAANLEMLLLHINTSISQSSFVLSNLTFEGIEGLKVFSLTNDSNSEVLFSLPPSIQMLTNVRTLRLNGLKLGNISFIASLTRLEVLDLRHCDFNELPYEIGNLTRLKLLDLSGCNFYQQTFNGAVGRCSQLEALYVLPRNTVQFVLEIIPKIVVDIGSLSKLQCFSIHDSLVLPYFSKRTRSLGLRDFNISTLRESKGNILQISENVAFTRLHGGCKNIIPDMVEVVGGMNDLTSLWLDECPEIECIFDITSNGKIDDLIPKFVELRLRFMDNLTVLCQGPILQVQCFFDKLEELVIYHCMNLRITFPRECNLQNLKILSLEYCKSGEVLFPKSVAQSLQQLEQLKIRNCHELKLIIAASGGEHGCCNPTSTHFLMPSLREVTILDCPMLESIFPICYVEGLAELKRIHIAKGHELKYIFGECYHEHHSSNLYLNHTMLPQLEVLKLSSLDNLIGMCPEYCHAKWPSHSLRDLVVEDCPKLDMLWIALMIRSGHSQHRLNEVCNIF